MRFGVYGWMEMSHGSHEYMPKFWSAVVDLSTLIRFDYGLFTALFGKSHFFLNEQVWGLPPIFGLRGLPENPSRNVLKDLESDEEFCPTYLTYQEYLDIDWDEERYTSVHLGVIKEKVDEILADCLGDVVVKRMHGVYHLYERRKLKKFARKGWVDVFRLMKYFANRYGEDNVRIVVYFK